MIAHEPPLLLGTVATADYCSIDCDSTPTFLWTFNIDRPLHSQTVHPQHLPTSFQNRGSNN